MYPVTFKTESKPTVMVVLSGDVVIEAWKLVKLLTQMLGEFGYTYTDIRTGTVLSALGVCEIEKIINGYCKCLPNDSTYRFRQFINDHWIEPKENN